MSYFAFVPNIVDGKGIVENVLPIEKDQIDSGAWGHPDCFIQTSYNTRGNVHYGQDGKPDGGIALRGNYAGIGYTYDQINDVFYPPQPFPSWSLNNSTWLWDAPVSYPEDGGFYVWDEAQKNWIDVQKTK